MPLSSRGRFLASLFLWNFVFSYLAAETPPPAQTSLPFSVLAPEGHFSPALQTEFKQKFGLELSVKTYVNASDAEVALQVPESHFDLVLLPDRLIAGLIQTKRLRPLPKDRGPIVEHFYLGHYFDIDNAFVWPYAWGLLSVAYNPDKVKLAPEHWMDLFTEDHLHHVSWDKQLDPEIKRAFIEKLAKYAESKHLVVPKIGTDSLELDSNPEKIYFKIGTYASLKTSPATWKFWLPEEGSLITLYHLALPVDSNHAEVADQVISWFMAPEHTCELAVANHLAVTQPEARTLVNKISASADPIIYPSLTIMSHSSFVRNPIKK